MTNPRRAGDGEAPVGRRGRVVTWVTMIAGLAAAGIAFAIKVTEFVLTLDSDEVPGFAEVPVGVYFLVAAGWVGLLVWSFATGKLRDLERPKYEMLEKEEDYEQRGE
jgi:hypothetical protein